MIYAESLAYTQPTAPDKHYLSIPELRQIGAIAGHEVLKCLDNKLKPQSLRDCSYGDIQALFLLVFGTILAISYTVPSPEDPELLNEVNFLLLRENTVLISIIGSGMHPPGSTPACSQTLSSLPNTSALHGLSWFSSQTSYY
jgi:hypothetical protein